MILLILGGLFALVVGKITITKNLRLSGKNARIYGALLIVLAFPFNILVSIIFSLLPKSLVTGEVSSIVLNLAAVVIFAIGLAIPFREK